MEESFRPNIKKNMFTALSATFLEAGLLFLFFFLFFFFHPF